jgi:Fe-S-cluster containining protein
MMSTGEKRIKHTMVCRRCRGKCCQDGIVIAPDDYDAMEAIVGARRMQAGDPCGIPGGVIFRAECPAMTTRGCLLLYDQRPKACRLYPFVRQPDGSLLLDPRCPSWKTFGEDFPR